jgi:AAA domain/Protein of unknown function (DUF4011)
VKPVSSTKKILQNYLHRLTDLSGNNRSLFLPKFSGDHFIDLQSLSLLNGEKSFTILEALIAGKKKTICPRVDARMEQSNEASKKVRRLQRMDQFLFEERGSKDLHVGWPFVRGKFNDGTPVRCPLLFFPVELIANEKNWVIKPREDSNILFNKTFLLTYAFRNQVPLDESLLEESFDEIDPDSTVFKTALYQLLQKANLDIHFNADNYRDELTPFVHYKRDDFDTQHRNGELKLFPEAVIGIFPQSGSFLVPDYLDLIENDRISDLETLFQTRHQNQPGEPSFIRRVKEEKLYTSFPLDAWQENALKAVKLGNSLVVHGPPGSGKSHLICNLISDGIANGKKILVVCQKRAALDVVYERLGEKNLSPFLGLVHDFRNDRKMVYEKIDSQIGRIDEYKSRNNSVDAVRMEREFYQASRMIDHLTDELEEFRSALFSEKESGISVKELYLRSVSTEPGINLKMEYQHLPYQDIDAFIHKLKLYSSFAYRFDFREYAWFDRRSFASYHRQDLKKLLDFLLEIPDFFQEILSGLHQLASANLTLDECVSLVERKKEVDDLLELISTSARFSSFQRMISEQADETSSLWLSNMERVLTDCFQHDGIETSLASSQLGQFQEALRRSMKARRGLIGWIRWELFSKDKMLIIRTLLSNGLRNNKEGFITIEKKLDNRLNFEHNISKLREKKWLTRFPESFRLAEFQHWFQDQQRAIRAREIFTGIRGLRNLADPANLTWQDFTERLHNVFKLLQETPVKTAIWLNYFTPGQLALLTGTNYRPDELAKILQRDFDGLVEFDRQKESLSPDELAIFQKLFSETGVWEYDKLIDLFMNSWSMAWIDHLETKFPCLTMASSGKLDLLESELRTKIRDKQRLGLEILALRARERVTDNLEFNRLNNMVTYRDLHHQVTKKKKVWPLRKLITEFEDEVFRVIPCWLVSPESASAIFPMREMFDLVIFDEASQCFAERGIPAIYRARQVVIAGDQQQLRPGDFYQARWQDEDESHPDLEIDSLLELGSRYLQSVDLRSHYRSQSAALIDFSNRRFYGGRLQLLPDCHAANQTEVPIEYHHVDGAWVDNTNQKEAEIVVTLVSELAAKDPGKSIGVVTFNAPQQNLILDLLEERSGLTTPSRLFVKNIENVQGDETDIIIFSMAYAPDKKGKLSAQFGSLNQQGGENRLNVAITRAREKIMVVASFWPEQLQVDETLNPGPRLLKDYLTFARTVSQGEFVPSVLPNREHHHDWYLKKRIRKEIESKPGNFDLVEDRFPLTDLTAVHGKKQHGIVLTDDEYYRDSLTAKERHALLPELLEQKNWKFASVYSRNYWNDPERFIHDIRRFSTPE